MYDVTTDAAVDKTVLVVGDSNIMLGVAQLTKRLTDRPHGHLPVFTARPGMGIRGYGDTTKDAADYWQIRLAQALLSVRPDVVVVNLGINDALIPGTIVTTGYSSYDSKIAWLLNLLPEVPVLWTNLPTSIEPAAARTGCQAINLALAAASKLTLVDWDAAAQGHPEYLDKVHLSDTGTRAYTRLVVDALDALP